MLTPSTYWAFAGKKYVNPYQFVVGPPGLRKSTSFKLVEKIGNAILDPSDIHKGNASDSAAFTKWQRQPHRIQIEEEGNNIVTAWRGSYSGKEIASRYLSLYDGSSWSQTFRHQADEGNEAGEMSIPEVTLSLAIGATPAVCRFSGVDQASGLRRRFGYYVADKTVRLINWPREFENSPEFNALVEGFKRVQSVAGEFRLDENAMIFWRDIQERNREQLNKLGRPDTDADEIIAGELSEAPSRILKLAAIFRVSRWAKDQKGDPLLVTQFDLATAAAHQDACLEASRSLDQIANRAANGDDAEVILATIRSEATNLDLCNRWKIESDTIVASRSDLTRRFAANGYGRKITAHRLHLEIMPEVIRKSGGRIEKGSGGQTTYKIPTEKSR